MIIALAQEIRELGITTRNTCMSQLADVDPKCVHMTYLQLALLHVPAIVVHGLTLEEIGHWYTSAHILDGWNWKLKRRAETAPDQPVPVSHRNRHGRRMAKRKNLPVLN
jgi:hypothetical protein